MKLSKMITIAFLVLGVSLVANPGAAALVTSLPGGTVIAMPANNYSGQGPQTFGPGNEIT